MTMTKEPIVFRLPRASWYVTAAAFAVVLAFTVIAFAVDLDAWYKAGFIVFCCLFPVAFAELMVEHVKIEKETLTFVKTFRRRVLRREVIDSVTWGKGVGVSLKLTDGQWVQLPPVGRTSQGLTNTIRAWLKRTAPSGGRSGGSR